MWVRLGVGERGIDRVCVALVRQCENDAAAERSHSTPVSVWEINCYIIRLVPLFSLS